MLNLRTEDVPLKSINIISEATFHSRRLGSKISVSEDSVEVYYRNGAVGKPFVWELEPGTPKIKMWESKPPPLTPPPSFHSISVVGKLTKNNLKALHDVKKTILQKSPSAGSSSSRLGMARAAWRQRKSSRSFDSRDDDYEPPVSCYYVFCCWA